MILDRLRFPDYNECQSFAFELPGKILTLRVPNQDCDYAIFAESRFSDISPSEKESERGLDSFTRLALSNWYYKNQNYEPLVQVNLCVGVIELKDGREKIFDLSNLPQFKEYIIDHNRRIALHTAKNFGWTEDELRRKYFYTDTLGDFLEYKTPQQKWLVSESGTNDFLNNYAHFSCFLTSSVFLDAAFSFPVYKETRPSEEDLLKLKQHSVEQFFKHVELTDYPAS